MLLKDVKFVGAYHFTSVKVNKETKEKTEHKWTSVCFELFPPEHAIGSIYKDLLMQRDKVPKDIESHLNENCIVDYQNNFCNEIMFFK